MLQNREKTISSQQTKVNCISSLLHCQCANSCTTVRI